MARTRIQKTASAAAPQQAESPVVDQNNQQEEKFQGFVTPTGDFDWDAYEATCPNIRKRGNPHIKVQEGDKVFSWDSYAQEFYDTLTSSSNDMSDFIPSIEMGKTYNGKVIGINETWCSVDIGYREMIYVRLDKEPTDYRDVRPGEETAVLITDVPEDQGHITGSISGGVKQKIFMDIRESIEEGNSAYIGTVESMISNGGYIVNIQGVDCFMPGSLAGINKLHDFTSIVGEEIYVVPVSFSNERGTIVVSHRKYLQALIPRELESIKENRGEKIEGTVTGTAKYGVFCEFNTCLTGMIHTNDLDADTAIAHKDRTIKPGDPISFWVKDIISEKKITLTQRIEDTVDPWDQIESRYQVPCNINAKVKTVKDYGIFVKIEEGIVGLLHISEIGEELIKSFNNGDDITVQVTRFDQEAKKVFLKLPQ